MADERAPEGRQEPLPAPLPASLPIPPLVSRLATMARRHETPLPGGRLVWHAVGAGPVLVLIHGGSGSWLHWVRNIEALSARARVLLVDLPSLGESDPGPAPFDPARWAAHVLAGLEAIIGRETPFVLAGFSFGGIYAGEVARQAGARVRELVLVGTAGFHADVSPTRFDLRSWRNLSDPEARLEAHRHNLAELMLADPRSIDDLALYVQATSTARSRFDSRNASVTGALLAILREIEAPITLVLGEADRTWRERREGRLAELHARRPDCAVHLLPGIGHWAMFEAPDAVNDHLGAALDRAFPATSSQRAPSE